VLDRSEQGVWKSFRNLGDRVQIVLPEELNPYDVLLNDWLVFSKATLEATTARLSDASRAAQPAPTERPAAAAVPVAAGSEAGEGG
jgi:large subunit ribosomal protein L4